MRFLTIFLAAGMAGSSMAQPADRLLRGHVLEAATGGPVVGANVILVGTLLGTITDVDGRFSMRVVREGSYLLRVTMTGLARHEEPVEVPDGLGEPLVIRLRQVRAALFEAPFLSAAESFDAVVAVPQRGNPLLTDGSTGTARIAEAGFRRYSAALYYPVIRGLSDGRSGGRSVQDAGGGLWLPGAGILDFASIAPASTATVAVTAPIASAPFAEEYVGIVEKEEASRERAGSADISYQSNTNALGARVSVSEAGHRGRFRAAGTYLSGNDFDSGAGSPWDGEFRQGGVHLAGEADISSKSRLGLSARYAAVGFAELPGSGHTLDGADHAGVRANFEWTPERARIRRVAFRLGWNLAEATLNESTDIPAVSRWTAIDVRNGSVDAATSVDLQTSAVDRLQTGLVVSGSRGDWSAEPFTAGLVRQEQVKYGRTRIVPFISGAVEEPGIEFSVAARLDAVRSRLHVVGEESAHVAWRVRPGASLRTEIKPDRRWGIALTLSTLSREPSFASLTPQLLRPVEALPSAGVRGSKDIGAERLWFAGARVAYTSDRLAGSVSPYMMIVEGFVTPSLNGTGQFEYTNAKARVLGFEATVRRQLVRFVTLNGWIAYTRGTNRAIGEPLPVILPLRARLDVTASAFGDRLLLELSGEAASRQRRVASSLGERESDGFATIHLWLGFPLARGVGLRTGVYNMLDADFAPHGYVYSESAGARLAAPGRAWLISCQIRL